MRCLTCFIKFHIVSCQSAILNTSLCFNVLPSKRRNTRLHYSAPGLVHSTCDIHSLAEWGSTLSVSYHESQYVNLQYIYICDLGVLLTFYKMYIFNASFKAINCSAQIIWFLCLIVKLIACNVTSIIYITASACRSHKLFDFTNDYITDIGY